MDLQPKEETRRIIYSDSYSHYEAYFHCWDRNSEGKLIAVVEYRDGTIGFIHMVGCIKFYDQERK